VSYLAILIFAGDSASLRCAKTSVTEISLTSLSILRGSLRRAEPGRGEGFLCGGRGSKVVGSDSWKRFGALGSTLFIQACLGSVYSWSRFVIPLRESYGICDSRAQILFGTLIGVFAFTMIVAGKLLDRVGLNRMAIGAGLFFSAGYYVAGAGTGSFSSLLFGLGGLAGFGTGLGYMAALTACIRWFPDRKGLATGLAVGAFGFGAIQMNLLADYFLGQGLDILAFFRGVGLSYGALIAGMGLMLPIPPRVEVTTMPLSAPPCAMGQELSGPRSWLRDPLIWGLGCGIFGGTAAGLLVIGNLLPLARAFHVSAAAQAVAISLFAIGNAAGRIMWGWLTDRLDWRAVEASLATMVGGLTLLLLTEPAPWLFVPAVLLIGFGFGACFVVYAGLIARHHGSWGIATIYPWLFALYGIAGIIAPTLGAAVFESTGGFQASLLLGLVAVGLAILANLAIHRRARPALLPVKHPHRQRS
jgi:MFS transporter, OFA family, oxalate/formate antiporter